MSPSWSALKAESAEAALVTWAVSAATSSVASVARTASTKAGPSLTVGAAIGGICKVESIVRVESCAPIGGLQTGNGEADTLDEGGTIGSVFGCADGEDCASRSAGLLCAEALVAPSCRDARFFFFGCTRVHPGSFMVSCGVTEKLVWVAGGLAGDAKVELGAVWLASLSDWGTLSQLFRESEVISAIDGGGCCDDMAENIGKGSSFTMAVMLGLFEAETYFVGSSMEVSAVTAA